MSGIFERIASLSGTELAKATNLAHQTYQERLAAHGHCGRALVESVAHVCRNHPNLIGIGVGLMVEHLLAEEKKKYDTEHEHDAPAATPLPTPAVGVKNAHLPHHELQLSNLRPGKLAWEVFGGVILLKLARTGVKLFRHKHQNEAWFTPLAKVHPFSAAFGAYHLAKALKAPKVSAWRNAWIALFLTDALKPVLADLRNGTGYVAPQATPAAQPQVAAQPAPVVQASPAEQPAPQSTPMAEPLIEPQIAPEPFEGHGLISQPVVIGQPDAVEPAPAPQPAVLYPL